MAHQIYLMFGNGMTKNYRRDMFFSDFVVI